MHPFREIAFDIRVSSRVNIARFNSSAATSNVIDFILRHCQVAKLNRTMSSVSLGVRMLEELKRLAVLIEWGSGCMSRSARENLAAATTMQLAKM